MSRSSKRTMKGKVRDDQSSTSSSFSVSTSSGTKTKEKAAMVKQVQVDMIDLRCLLIVIAMLEMVNGVSDSLSRCFYTLPRKNLKTPLFGNFWNRHSNRTRPFKEFLRRL